MADRRSMVRWNRNADMNSVTSSLRDIRENLVGQVEDVVMESTEAGAEGMREAIRMDTKTDWVGTGQYATEGRQDHGLMLDGIKEDIEPHGTLIRGHFGWLKGTSEWLDYFGYQEHGFRHWVSGAWIPGVQAAMHGAQRAKSVMAAGMKSLNLRRKVTRRMQKGYDPDNAARDTY